LGLEIDGGDTELGDALEPFDEGAKEGVKIGRMTVEEGYREEVLELVANLGSFLIWRRTGQMEWGRAGEAKQQGWERLLEREKEFRQSRKRCDIDANHIEKRKVECKEAK
jgi:hypothetical protein